MEGLSDADKMELALWAFNNDTDDDFEFILSRLSTEIINSVWQNLVDEDYDFNDKWLSVLARVDPQILDHSQKHTPLTFMAANGDPIELVPHWERLFEGDPPVAAYRWALNAAEDERMGDPTRPELAVDGSFFKQKDEDMFSNLLLLLTNDFVPVNLQMQYEYLAGRPDSNPVVLEVIIDAKWLSDMLDASPEGFQAECLRVDDEQLIDELWRVMVRKNVPYKQNLLKWQSVLLKVNPQIKDPASRYTPLEFMASRGDSIVLFHHYRRLFQGVTPRACAIAVALALSEDVQTVKGRDEVLLDNISIIAEQSFVKLPERSIMELLNRAATNPLVLRAIEIGFPQNPIVAPAM